MKQDLIIGIISGIVSSSIISTIFYLISGYLHTQYMIKQEKSQLITDLLSIEYAMGRYFSLKNIDNKNDVYEEIQRKIRSMPRYFNLEKSKYLSDDFYKSYNRLKLFLLDINNELIQGYEIKSEFEYFKEKREGIWIFIDELQRFNPLKKSRFVL